MGVLDSRSMRVDIYVRIDIISFVELLVFLFGVFGENLCIVFLLLVMVLWVPISATLCRRAVLMMCHAFMFLGLVLFSLFFFLLGVLWCFLL
jgi:hypothetical protein